MVSFRSTSAASVIAPPANSAASAGSAASARNRWWWHSLDILIPLVIFAKQIGLWTLRPTAAAAMMRGDWTTYIAAPNFLRSAPLFTFPLGRVPGYISPPGISLAMADANPLFIPLYRLGNALSPERPVQFIGWFLLVAYLLTYRVAVRFILAGARGLRGQGSTLATPDLIATRALAAALLIMPMFAARWIHVSLTNQWLVIAALFLAIFHRQLTRRSVAARLAVVLLATAIQPYFLPMVAIVMVPAIVDGLRRRPALTTAITVATATAVIGVAHLLGYLGDGFAATFRDYGSFPADVTTIFSPRGYGRWLPDLPHHPKNTEGLGFVGLGVLILLVAACVLLARRRLPRRVPGAAWAVLAATMLLAVFATWPRVRIFGYTVLDVSSTPLALTAIGRVFRVNGRFIWPAIWLVALGAAAVAVAWRHRWQPLLIAAVVIVQFVDTRPEHIAPLPTLAYDQSARVLAEEQAAGATSVQLQPPWVAYQCAPGYGLTDYGDVAPFVLAAAVLHLPVNSGYPSRPAIAARRSICNGSTLRFTLGLFDPHVVYSRPIAAPLVPELRCRMMTERLRACRTFGSQG